MLKQFNGIDVHIQLVHMMLAKIAEFEIPVRVPNSGLGRQNSHDDLEQRRFSGPVIANLPKTYITRTEILSKFELITMQILESKLAPRLTLLNILAPAT